MALRVDPTVGLDSLPQDWLKASAAIIPVSGNVFIGNPPMAAIHVQIVRQNRSSANRSSSNIRLELEHSRPNGAQPAPLTKHWVRCAEQCNPAACAVALSGSTPACSSGEALKKMDVNLSPGIVCLHP